MTSSEQPPNPSSTCDRAGLAALAEKYEALWSLRQAGGDVDRARMRAVSREFPGALRELDGLAAPELLARLRHVRAVLAGGEPEAWLIWLLAYHSEMQLALTVQRCLGRNAARARAEPRAFARLLQEQGITCELGRLQDLLAPPSGRLNRVVFGWLSRRFAVSPEALEAALFPHPGFTDIREREASERAARQGELPEPK